jgi:hypothetical protein
MPDATVAASPAAGFTRAGPAASDPDYTLDCEEPVYLSNTARL